MTKDEQARARLVEVALAAAGTGDYCEHLRNTYVVRTKAGFRNPSTGSWCAAGLTAAMEDAGLVVPAPGTPARRGAVALLDWVGEQPGATANRVALGKHAAQRALEHAQPGDVIAWLQNKAPEEWRHLSEAHEAHAFRTAESSISMCAKISRYGTFEMSRGMKRCSSCVWETRKGHVALIVGVAENSIWTVGWNEGAAPGRVIKRQLWRDPEQACVDCYERGSGKILVRIPNTNRTEKRTCPSCKGTGRVPRSSTVLYRRPGGLYGIARPVAR